MSLKIVEFVLNAVYKTQNVVIYKQVFKLLFLLILDNYNIRIQ